MQISFQNRVFVVLAAVSILGAFAFPYVRLKLLASIPSQSGPSPATIQAAPPRGSALAARKLFDEFIGRVLTSGSPINMQDPVILGDTATVLASNEYRDCKVTLHKDQNVGNEFGWLVSRVSCESK